MKLLFLILLLQSSLLLAEEKVVKKDLTLLGKIDEQKEAPKPSKPVLETNAKTSDSKFFVTCKDATGKEIKKGEVDFETCLAGIKGQHEINKLNGGANNNKDIKANSATVNFKIGD